MSSTQTCKCGWREGDSHPSWHEHCEHRREPERRIVPDEFEQEYEHSEQIQSALIQFRADIDNGKNVFGAGEIDVILEALQERGVSLEEVRNFFRKVETKAEESQNEQVNTSELSPEDLPF